MEDIKKQIESLNEKIIEDNNPSFYLKYTQIGFFVEQVDLIIQPENSDLVLETYIWDSENNPLEWDEVTKKYESFESLFLRRIEDIKENLDKLTNLIKS